MPEAERLTTDERARRLAELRGLMLYDPETGESDIRVGPRQRGPVPRPGVGPPRRDERKRRKRERRRHRD